jgi:hypothetical protein
MFKFVLIAAATAAVLAPPLMSSDAEAGGCGGYGAASYGRPAYQSYSSPGYSASHRFAKPKVRFAAKKAPAKPVKVAVTHPKRPAVSEPAVAAAAPAIKPASDAKVAALDTVASDANKVAAPVETEASKENVCRRYLAATGGMVDVPCE